MKANVEFNLTCILLFQLLSGMESKIKITTSLLSKKNAQLSHYFPSYAPQLCMKARFNFFNLLSSGFNKHESSEGKKKKRSNCFHHRIYSGVRQLLIPADNTITVHLNINISILPLFPT